MQNYNCKVRLAGKIANEVFKEGVTAAEIIMFRHVHGDDSVVNISPTIMDKRSHEEERKRLSDTYGPEKVLFLFGPGHNRLPVELDPEMESELAEKVARARGEEAAMKARFDAAVEAEVERRIKKK